MKTNLRIFTLWLGCAVLAVPGWARQDGGGSAPAPSPATNAALPDAGSPAPGAAPGLRFNFRGAPLETVLNYMSDAAGFIIVLQTPVSGTVDMWSNQPVSREEAVAVAQPGAEQERL